MVFFKNFVTSAYNPKNYQNLEKKPLSSALWYFARLVALATLLLTIVFAIKIIPASSNISSEGLTNIEKIYPAELEVVIKNGEVSSNVAEPYFIKFPGNIEGDGNYGKQNLLVIDTQNDQSLERYKGYSTILWLGRDSLMYLDDHNKISIQPLGDISFTINRDVITSLFNYFKPLIKILVPVILILVFIAVFLFKLAVSLIYLLIVSLLILLVCKIIKWPFTYKDLYKATLYAYSWPLVLSFAVMAGFLPKVNFLPSLLLLIIFFVNYGQFRISDNKNK